MKRDLLKKIFAFVVLTCLFGINSYAIDRTKATAQASGIVGGNTIVYTLTHGAFRNNGDGVIIENWTIGGQNGQDLGAITSISIENLTVATITVTGEVDNYSSYTISPNSAAIEIFFYAPDETSITLIERAEAMATAVEGNAVITYTLSKGQFIESLSTDLTSNWTIDGQDGQDLGAITSISMESLTVAKVTVTGQIETNSSYTIQPSKEIIEAPHAQPSPVPVDVQLIAKAQAQAIASSYTIEYMLTAGLFSSMEQRGGGLYCENPSNWVIGGQEGQYLGDISSISVSDDRKSAVLTVTNSIELTYHYTIKPLSSAIASPHASPHEVAIQVGVSTSSQNREVSKLSVFPNPSNGVFSINSANAYVLEIYNVQGVCVKKQDISSGVSVINMQHENSGAYILKLRNEQEIRTITVVKN
jgi:hypothetical protein